jgi:phage tail tape-measure protein
MATQKLNIDIVARDKSKQALNSLKGRLSKVKASIFNLRNAFIGLGAGLVIRNLVNTGKQLEGLQVRLKFLFGSAQEGAKAFDEMSKYASKVPFSLEQIQQGAGVLAVVSKDAEQMAKMMKITGNVAAVTGLDFRTTAEQIQRSMSAGISAADLFRDRGVKAMLGFKAGATVSIEETVAAFDRVFGEGGKFDGATDALAKTFEGTLSMIGDEFFNFKKTLLEAGFFEELKKQFGDLDKFLKNNAKEIDKIATAVGENLAQGIVGAVKIGKDLIPTLKNIGKALKGMIDGFNALPDFVKEVGLIGAVLFGKKGVVALAGISFIMDKITDFVNDTKIKAGIIDTSNLKDVQTRLDIINNKLDKGTIIMDRQKVLTDDRYVDLKDVVTLSEDTIKQLKKEKEELQLILLNSKGALYLLVEQNKKKKEFLRLQKEEFKHLFDIGKAEKSIAKSAEKNRKLELFLLEEKNKRRLEFLRLEKEAMDKIGEQKTTFEQIGEQIKKNNEEFSLSGEIFSTLQSFTSSFSRSLAEALVYGKSLNKSFKELAKGLLVDILAKMIERIILLGIEKLIIEKLFKQDTKRLDMEKNITAEKRKQVYWQTLLLALTGGASFFGLGGSAKQHGGAVSKGRPVLVGERGPELFYPNTTGQITQNARGTGGGPVNVNFSITALDASGFSEMLIQNRGTISHIINQAVNERGASNIV